MCAVHNVRNSMSLSCSIDMTSTYAGHMLIDTVV